MNAPRTIPRATLEAAISSLGIDIPFSEILSIQMGPRSVTVHTFPNFDALHWRIVDECPSCHTHAGHPHTDYCHATENAAVAQRAAELITVPAASYPFDSGKTPYHQQQAAHDPQHTCDARCDWPYPAAEPWVDNGCRCPNPNQHRDGCPALDETCTCPTDADVTPQMRTATDQHLANCPLAS